MGGDRDNCGGMQRELSVAASIGTRGGGWGDRSFLHRNAGKMTTIEAKHENLSKETAKHHACPEPAPKTQSTAESEGYSSNSVMR